MQNPVIRSVLAIVLSITVAVGLFMAIEGIGAILHPWPEDFGGSFEEIAAQVASYPVWVLALLGGVGYGLIFFLCTYIATRLGHNRNPWYGYGVGIFLFAMIVLNLTKLPYPTWYWVLEFTILPIAAYLGTRLGMQNQEVS